MYFKPLNPKIFGSVDNTGAAQRDVCSMTSALSTRSPRHPGLISFNPVRTVPYPSTMSVPYSTSPPVLYPSSLPPYSYTRVPVTNSKYPYPHTGAGDAGVIPSQIPYDETSRTVLDGHCGPNSYQVTNESHRKTQDRLSRGIASQTEQTHSSRRNSDTRSCDQRNLDSRNSDQRNSDSRNSDQRNLDSRNSDQTNSDSRNSDQRDCDGICDQNNSDRKTSDSICDERQQPSPLVSRFLKTSANTALDFREFPQGVSPLDNCVNNNYNNSQYPTNNNHASHCNDNCVHSPSKGVSYSTNPSLYSSNPHSSIHSASNPLVPHTRPNNSTSHYFPNHNTPSIASHTTPSARLPQRAFLQSVNPSNSSTSQATKDPTRVKFPAQSPNRQTKALPAPHDYLREHSCTTKDPTRVKFPVQSPNRQTKALPANANTKLISPNSQTSHKVPHQSARLPQRAFLQSVNPSNNSTSQATKDPTRVKFPAQSPNRQIKALPANANTKLISPNSQTSHKVPNQSIPTGHSGTHPDPHMSTDRKYPATRHNLTNNVNCDTNSILVDNLSDMATDANVGRLMVDGVRIHDMKPADDAVSESTHAVSESTHADSSDSAIELDSNPNLSGAESTLTSGESTLTSGESTLTSGESTLTSGDSNKELMTQISNDLDYLLNTHEDYTPRSLKRNRKGSSPSGGAKMKMSPGHLARHTALAGGVMRNTADLVTTSKK
ncbi:homeobox protein 2-like [Diaphorina citri]|uniref:Homeobox protein 2-like n=1 Tax=Diaphorina citri TaxID=121845 RepID=A0A3Q0J7F6_DIACI|nr:homeobox protein 2-like [Diaphorina citri]